MTKKIDWQKISEWDNKYIVKCYATEQEYATIPIESTEGDYLIMPDGTRLLDFYNQLFCVNIGQKIPEVQEAIAEALARYGFIWDIYTSDYKAEVAKLIIEDILGEYDWPGQIRFTLGGGDSVEIATMLARLVTGKTMIATREHSYHGVSGVATSLTRLYPGRSHLCAGSSDMLRQVPGATYQGSVMCPAPFCYRCPLGHDYPACKGVYTDGMLPCVKQTEQIIRTYGADNFAAIITEPAFGAGSIVSPAMEYLTQIYEMKQRLGILWIMDEVMMGFGRLGEWFGYQKYDKNIRPDLVTMAKGITSSALPLGAVLISQDVAAVLKKTRWNHVSTFSG
ncbi:MAG: aminotransferase class III-fold pyridoxal phosphate-dependent enzyme, partial [Clostridiales bacterium]